jgi:hypothetical protein
VFQPDKKTIIQSTNILTFNLSKDSFDCRGASFTAPYGTTSHSRERGALVGKWRICGWIFFNSTGRRGAQQNSPGHSNIKLCLGHGETVILIASKSGKCHFEKTTDPPTRATFSIRAILFCRSFCRHTKTHSTHSCFENSPANPQPVQKYIDFWVV